MTFYEMLAQVIELLQQHERLSYRALKAQFELDDERLDMLKEELIDIQEVARDQGGRMLVWDEADHTALESDTQLDQTTQQPTVQKEPPAQIEPPLTESPRPDAAERRQLTVMFVDLVGSTSLSGELDPEDYRSVVREYQKTCTEVIERYDGYVAQYLGDGLLVYFGYPQSHEDEAQRAVHTGLAILHAMKQLNARLDSGKDIQLALRIGIHTGLVVVGDIGEGSRQEQLALGEVPNVAARIQGLAEPDTIVISDATYRLAEGYFACQTLGEQSLRGVAEPVVVHQVLRESGVQSRLDVSSARGLTPLVGREQETGLLIERWSQAKEGQGQVILLSGDAGIGKSRLVQVLKDHVAAEPHIRLECRSSPYFTNSALYPIVELLQRTLRWQQNDTSEQRLEKLERELSQYRLSLEESVPLFGSLLALAVPEDRYPPLTLSPQRQRQKTLECIIAILLDLAESQPVLFILEDLHWTDPTTLELIDLLLAQTPTASIGVLLTCRPDYQPSWSRRSYLTEMTIHRLSREQIELMAMQVAGGKTLPVDVIGQLVDRTDGVPLYVEEMTKTVLESGVLKEIEGQYELTGSISTLSIPATLQDSLMSRLDRLMTAKVVAQLGATIGRQFSYELLQAVSQLDETMLQHELARLVEAELVYQRGLPPQATYMFKHALIQDTASESLLRTTRQGYHQRIAEVLEERFPETAEQQPELLAHHYTEAGLNERAVGYWHQAGQQAIARSAYVEGIVHLTRGIHLIRVLPETSQNLQFELEMQVALGPILQATKGMAVPEVEQTYGRARELCQQLQDAPQLFSVLRGIFGFYTTSGRVQTALEVAEEMHAIAQQRSDIEPLILSHYALGSNLFYHGELTRSRYHLEQSIAHYDAHQNTAGSLFKGWADSGVHSRAYCIWVLWVLGYPEQASELSREAFALAVQLEHPFSVASLSTFIARVYQCCGDVDATLEYAQRAMDIGSEQGFVYYRTCGTLLSGWALAAQGQTDKGITRMQQGLEEMRATRVELNLTYFFTLPAGIYARLGRTREAFHIVENALTLVKKNGERCYESELLRLKGELLLIQTSDSQPETCFKQALDIARNQQAKSLELRAATSLARMWHSQDKRQDAYDLLAPVYGWFTEGFDTADLKDAKTLLDELA